MMVCCALDDAGRMRTGTTLCKLTRRGAVRILLRMPILKIQSGISFVMGGFGVFRLSVNNAMSVYQIGEFMNEPIGPTETGGKLYEIISQ
jgi:hypothetical protein